jgi:hypothetical protein
MVKERLVKKDKSRPLKLYQPKEKGERRNGKLEYVLLSMRANSEG